MSILTYLHPTKWLWLCFHGVLLVVASSLFMVFAVSGLPAFTPTHGPLPSFPAIIPLHTGPRLLGALKTHVRDIIIGSVLILAGLGLTFHGENRKGAPILEDKYIRSVLNFLVAVTWILFITPKLYLYIDVDLI